VSELAVQNLFDFFAILEGTRPEARLVHKESHARMVGFEKQAQGP
jgi:hypothetical protein